MARYARVYDGRVAELFETDGDITQMFPPAIIWVNIDEQPAVQYGWIAEFIDGVWKFRPWAPSAEDILNNNTLTKNYKETQAHKGMALSLVDAKLCYYDTTGTTATAKLWQEYWGQLQAVDLTVENPVWPVKPE